MDSIELLRISAGWVWFVFTVGATPDSMKGQESASLAGDLYSVSPGSVEDPDIVWSKRIPTVNQNINISARVRGPGEHPVAVRFVLEANGVPEVVLSASPSLQQIERNESRGSEEDGGAYMDYEAHWRPTQAGIYRLTVEVDPENTSGDAVTENNVATVTLPVVWREIQIIPWGSTRHLRWVTGIAREFAPGSANIPDLDYWKRRGTKVLGYMYTIERELMKLSEKQMVKSIVKKADQYVRAGCDGLIIDETGSYDTPDGLEFIRRFGRAYDLVREKYPHLIVYNWISGPLHYEELMIASRNGHILIGQSYEAIHASHGPTWRYFLEGRVCRLGTSNIIALGVGGDTGRRFLPQIENSVQLYRRLESAMPGICYYGIGYLNEGESYEGSFHEFIDELTFNYFIKPVLMVRPADIQASKASPHIEEKISLQVGLWNIGGIPAKNVGINICVRHLDTNERTFLARAVIPEIGNGTTEIIEEKPASTSEKVLKGTKHPMMRFGKTSEVILERALVDASWTPDRSGDYRFEVELQPSDQYTILEGFAQRKISVAAETQPEPKLEAEVIVTEDDVWLSDYSPSRNEPVSLQVRVHNVGKIPAKNVGVKIHAQHLSTNQRTFIASTVIPEIGTEVRRIEEEKTDSNEHKVINGAKYPMTRYGNTSVVLMTRALVDATWTPSQSGYYQIEVEGTIAPLCSVYHPRRVGKEEGSSWRIDWIENH